MRIPFLSGAITGILLLAVSVTVLVLHPETPLPREWNPKEPLRVSDPYSPLTRWKSGRAARSLELCLAAMDTAELVPLPALEVSDTCGIAQRVGLSRIGDVTMSLVETDCRTALGLALWERHDLQRSALETMGAKVSRIEHFSSYSCRRMRTSSGQSGAWSTHATGKAIDVSGFRLSDGTVVDLRQDWDGAPHKQAFLRNAQRGACLWFGGVLGPDFNELHADHFHLQTRGRGFCR